MQESLVKELSTCGIVYSMRINREVDEGKGWTVSFNLHGSLDNREFLERQRGGKRIFKTLDAAVKTIYELGYKDEIKIPFDGNSPGA